MRIGAHTLLGRYIQRPSAERRRLIDYSKWLSDGEVVTDVEVEVSPTTDPVFVIDRIVIGPDGDKIAYYASGGVDKEEYTATFTVTTSTDQSWPHDIRFGIREPAKYTGD